MDPPTTGSSLLPCGNISISPLPPYGCQYPEHLQQLEGTPSSPAWVNSTAFILSNVTSAAGALLEHNYSSSSSSSSSSGWDAGNSSNISSYYSEYEDYRANGTSASINWGELAPVLIIYAVTYLVGVTGNALIIYTVLHFRRLKSTTNVFLISLSSADLLLVLVCIPVKLARLFSYTWTLGLLTCKLVYYVQTVSAFCSVLTLVTISLERYYAIVYPMRAQYRCTMSKARRLSLVIWVLALLLAAPVLVVQVHMEVGMYVTAYWCVRDFDSQFLWPAYETYVLLLLLVLPVTIMASAYFSICSAVFSMVETRREMSNGLLLGSKGGPASRGGAGAEERNEIKQVVTMLVVVVALFVVCWAPILVINVLKAYQVIGPYSVTLKHIVTMADLLSYINSCLNPVIYGFMSRHFREGFLSAVSCGRSAKHKRSFSTNSRGTSVTRMSVVRMQDTSRGSALTSGSYHKPSYCPDDVSINNVTVC